MLSHRNKRVVLEKLNRLLKDCDDVYIPLDSEILLDKLLERISIIVGGWAAQLSELIEQLELSAKEDEKGRGVIRPKLPPPKRPPEDDAGMVKGRK